MAVTVVCCYVVMLRGWIRPGDTLVMKSLVVFMAVASDIVRCCMYDFLTYFQAFSDVQWIARSPCCDAGSGRVAVIIVCCYVV